MKGIVLAGGAGTRLEPLTKITSKQLLPIYDKPMIYYPIQTLFNSGIREILLISTPNHLPLYRELLQNHDWDGLQIDFEVQPSPGGIPQAFIIGERHIGGSDVVLILGDNIFIGSGAEDAISSISDVNGAEIFGKKVADPERFGVAEIDNKMNIVSIEEKPDSPKSDIAVVGLYVYDNSVVEKAKDLIPSSRGELEISDLNNTYLEERRLKIRLIDDETKWLDTGTFDSLLDAAIIIRNQGMAIIESSDSR